MTTVVATSSSNQRLATLLALCTSLHHGSSSSGPDSSWKDTSTKKEKPVGGQLLSLRQLVPVHEALCRAVVQLPGDDDDASKKSHAEWDQLLSNSGGKASLLAILARVCSSDQERAECEQILLPSSPSEIAPPQQILLAVQYVLYSSPYFQQLAPLQGLAHVVLPVLVESLEGLARDTVSIQDHDDNWDEEEKSRAVAAAPSPVAMELLDALLDVILSGHGKGEAELWRGLHTCLDACVASPSDDSTLSSWQWTVHCRILARLHAWLLGQSTSSPDTIQNALDRVLQAMVDKVVQGAWLPTTQQHHLALSKLWLRPLTTELIPYLLEHLGNKDGDDPSQGREQMSILWQQIWAVHLQNPDAYLLPTTSILCSLLPSLAKVPLPVVQTDSEGTVAAEKLPWHQPALWQLVHSCLQQGIPQKTFKGSTVDKEEQYKTAQMIRRRGLYLLRLVVPPPPVVENDKNNKKKQQQQNGKKQGKKKAKQQRQQQEKKQQEQSLPQKSEEQPQVEQPQDKENQALLLLWNQYVHCMETLEMEREQHLVDQVWPTVALLFQEAAKNVFEEDTETAVAMTAPPPLTWKWAQLLLSKVMTSYDSPVVRKLALFRLFQGRAGILVTPPETTDTSVTVSVGAPLVMLSPEFVCDIIISSFDTLSGSCGTMIHWTNERKEQMKDDMKVFMSNFMQQYVLVISNHPQKLQDFVHHIWKEGVVCQLHAKTVVQVHGDVAAALERLKENNTSGTISGLEAPPLLEMTENTLNTVVQSWNALHGAGSVVRAYRDALLESLAKLLSHSSTGTVEPKAILRLLALFPWDESMQQQTAMKMEQAQETQQQEREPTDPNFSNLQNWIQSVGKDAGKTTSADSNWITTVASTVAMAFVRGDLLESVDGEQQQLWDPKRGCSVQEQDLARATAYLCAILGAGENTATTAGELLWPAINKGIANVPVAMLGSTWIKADVVARAILLLDFGCRLEVLSGLGNGDIVLDRKTQQMMPPPPNIESLLSQTVGFLIHNIGSLLEADDGVAATTSSTTRSSKTRMVSTTFANLIAQMQTFYRAYPSSMAVTEAVDQTLRKSLEQLANADESTDVVKHITLAYAVLSSGATVASADDGSTTKIVSTCQSLLNLQFRANSSGGKKPSDIQSARSIFQYAKWGVLSCLMPELARHTEGSEEIEVFLVNFFDTAFDAVHEVPADALVPLFRSVTVAARRKMLDTNDDAPADPETMERIIKSLLALMEECHVSQDTMFMLHEICALVFQPRLLIEEYLRLKKDPANALTPVRNAFRQFIELAGTLRSHVTRVLLLRATVGWLGTDKENLGLGAIPYRDDIIDLLQHKETKVDISVANQSVDQVGDEPGTLYLPRETDESSIARGFVLVFISELPSPESGLSKEVLQDLLHHVIFGLLSRVNPVTSGKKKANAIDMTGSEGYCRKIRGWQALCCLSRFVTADIAERVRDAVFPAMQEALHGQVRYFLEVFTLQCARMHPQVFGRAILENIMRKDLTLQHITSLMIISGNLIVGRYQLDFFRQYDDGAAVDGVPLNRVLVGVIPWLGSTQGFSRAIAQLLVHKLIPLVIDVDEEHETDDDSKWFLRCIYRFLEENQDMKRLRAKQSNFFSSYDADGVCNAEGVLSIPVDEGGEANPIHMADEIKKALKTTYKDIHGNDAPVWKQVDEMLKAQDVVSGEESETDDSSSLVNFQRKIIPLDELNLAMEEMREKRMRNIAGRKKHELIVCAGLIDKIPNLGGLARTAEIFAAKRLIIPDLNVCKTDTFTNLSVGAGDWIDIEECREENLLRWLRDRKREGYFIVGVEQTSSSVPLESFEFPDQPVVLLLGKEKEGIPVELLQCVDQCVEIPQFGIIRSLNVHVSGALAIWEYTRRKIMQENALNQN